MTTREVVLDGGSPWGFRLHGGADVHQPLRISRVNPGSKAALRGIREGDFITSINNRSTKDITNAEAHALLRNSGDTLKLGLNEDTNGSPKRRQYKTVHQETHSETVKKSSITSYTVTSSKTVSQTETSNEQQTSKVNGNSNVNGDPSDQTKPLVVSQRSTLSSTCSSSSSTPSTYTSLTSPSGTEMADNARSRRKRARNNRKKAKQNVNTTEIIAEESGESVESPIKSPVKIDEYHVESPKRIKSPEPKKPIKSRSLDDDDLIKIQELSEVSESEDKSECKAIVSEAESDVEWETAVTMEDPQVSTGTVSTLSLPLEQYTTEQVSLISPEEELNLRNFLEGLNLVNCPEDSFKQVRELSTIDSVKSRRARKRAAIEQYFLPMTHNPRYLEVISEEASDLSDREQPSLTHHLKQGTPEPELPPKRPAKTRKVIDNPAILVGTKIIGTHEICSTSVPQSSTQAEVVYLEDSSNSTTPDPKSDDDEKDTNDDILSSTNSSVPDLRESEGGEETKQVKKDVEEKGKSCEDAVKVAYVSELTPPPTPVDISPKSEDTAKAAVVDVEEMKNPTISTAKIVEVNVEKEVKERVINVEVERESAHETQVPVTKERIINVEVEKDFAQNKTQLNNNSVECSCKNVTKNEIKQEQSPKILKLDDMTPPIVLKPEGFSFAKPQSSQISSESVEGKRKIEVMRSDENFSPKVNESKFFPEMEKFEKVESISSENKNKDKIQEKRIINKEVSSKQEVSEFSSERERTEHVSTVQFSSTINKKVEDDSNKKLENVSKDSKSKITYIPIKVEDSKNEKVSKENQESTKTKVSGENEIFRKKVLQELDPNKVFSKEASKITYIPIQMEVSKCELSTKVLKESATEKCVNKKESTKDLSLGKSFSKKSESKTTYIPIKLETSKEVKELENRISKSLDEKPKDEFKKEEFQQKEITKELNKESELKTTYVPIKLESSEDPKPKEKSVKEENEIFNKPKTTYIPIKLESTSGKEVFKNEQISQVTSESKNEESKTRYISIKLEPEMKQETEKLFKSEETLPEMHINLIKSKPKYIPINLEFDIGKETITTVEKNTKTVKKEESIENQDSQISEPTTRYIPIEIESELEKEGSKREEPSDKSRLQSLLHQNIDPDATTRSIPVKLEETPKNERSSKPPEVPPRKNRPNKLEVKSKEPEESRPKRQTSKERQKLKTADSPSKEVESICSNLKPAESIFYSNVISPPAPSPSPSLSSGSSSRATSLCTAKYSPIADLASLKDDDFHRAAKNDPLTLRELCVNFLMAQPFGSDILQELADVSSSIDRMTKDLLDPKVPAFMEKEWVGLASEEDPRLVVCLSPTQKAQLDKSRKVSDEAGKLLDLHSKFIYRTTYHDAVERRVKNEVEITAIKPESNRLLAIIRGAQEPEKFSTFPRNASMESARLRARDLSEWLRLARNKSRSELNLNENSQNGNAQRRKSLPQDLYEQQMEYLREKEREIQQELEMLEEEKRRLATELSPKRFREEDYHISKKGDFAESRRTRPLSMPISTEIFRQQMYEEYMDKIAAREERKHHKVIKVSQIETPPTSKTASGIENEFMHKVKEKQKLGKLGGGDSSENTDDEQLPKHLQEFLDIAKQSRNSPDGVWSPGQKQELKFEEHKGQSDKERDKDEPLSPVWTPKSATSSPTVERKEFRPVKFESPVLGRKNLNRNEENSNEPPSKEPPWKVPDTSSDTGITLSSTLEKRLPTSHSSPASGFNDFPTTRLPRAQNPTITLLQKAREGQLPKGALYIEQDQPFKRLQNDKPPMVGPGEILYKIKHEYTSESDSEKPRKMADLGPRKFEGIGPTTKDGMPLILRSEVKDANQSKWYKRMYDTIHKQRPHRDEFVTVRYKQKRGQYPYTSGYLSEPEPGAYDSDVADYKYATLDRRRPLKDKENDHVASSTMPRTAPEKVGAIKHGHDPYKNQPGRIENYIPGHSSISEKEAKEWWDEVMDIFDGHLEQQKRVPQKSFINQALKESGYESDSTLIFRRRDDTAQQLSPSEQKEAYKIIQKGGDIPLHGLRKPAPERPKESPRKYVENEVTIHYKTPVRQEIKEYLSEDELAYRQAEAMKKIYQEERRRKYLQELQDMNNRRHTDNFIPSQKSPIPLNRYDDLDDLAPPVKPRPRSPEPRLMARALYNFVGQTARELTFRKGDLIYVRRQVDKNWYEGELNAMVGLFPVNYVEIVTYDTNKPTPRKSHEGQARAKYNFVAQTHLELSLAKGELVIITRRVDDNWFEGKIGGRKGIFPVSYVDVLIDPSDPPPAPTSKPVAAPAAHSLLLNGSSGGKESMGSHSYTPSLGANQLTTSYHAKPVQVTGYGSLNRGPKNSVNQALHIETQAEPIPYRALYKYLPQNDDELELLEGDTVYVLEKCDDGWYVGSSDRTGAFGTFPGNYVEKI